MMNINELTEEELERVLRDKKKKNRLRREKERKEYELHRDKSIAMIMSKADSLSEAISAFKQLCHRVMEEQHARLSEYGEIRASSKGGFSVTNTQGNWKITRRRDTEPTWDERAEKAIELVREFIYDTVKKRDKDLFDILLGFLEKNQAGDLEYGRVFNLIKYQDRFDDPRWNEGLRLLKESFSHSLRGYGYEFKIKDETGKWRSISLNFSAL